MGIFDAASLPSGPTSQQISSSSIQPWAQPYISNYLAKSQALANQAPTAFQNQVYSSAQNMGVPEQFAQGSSLAQQGGQGQLSTAPLALGYGSQGVGIGALGQAYGFGAGQNYINQATSPSAIGAFMNPYVQQSLKPQLDILNQQQQLAAQNINAQAAGKGAFGGNRATLAQGLNAQNYDLARQQAVAQGYNQAFQNAQQAQQFGANLGLQGAQFGTQAGLQGLATALQGVQGAQQGYSGATQAGSALGNIGAQQGQYELAKIALQNQIANQQYLQPFQQQQFMQSMMSGLPISTQTQQGFQAPPNALSQMAGIGTTLVGGIGALNKAGLLPSFGSKKPTATVMPYNGGSYIPNENPAMDNRDVGMGENTSPDYVAPVASYEDIATGGHITSKGVKRYADGGDVQDGIASLPAGVASAMGAAMQPRSTVVDQSPVSSDELANLYQQYLGRGVDESGAKSFTGLDRTSVINSILNSPEYQSRGISVPNAPMTGNILQNAGGKGDQLGMLGRIIGSSMQRQPATGNDLATLQLNRLLGTAV